MGAVGGGGWRWRRYLLLWEEELVMECGVMLENMLYVNVSYQLAMLEFLQFQI
jgi:hypothetical protein